MRQAPLDTAGMAIPHHTPLAMGVLQLNLKPRPEINQHTVRRHPPTAGVTISLLVGHRDPTPGPRQPRHTAVPGARNRSRHLPVPPPQGGTAGTPLLNQRLRVFLREGSVERTALTVPLATQVGSKGEMIATALLADTWQSPGPQLSALELEMPNGMKLQRNLYPPPERYRENCNIPAVDPDTRLSKRGKPGWPKARVPPLWD